MTADSPKVYSYIRFSTKEQSQGDSLRRQTAAANRYAADNGLELDEELSIRDLGSSAYSGKHLSHGALGRFWEACEAGMVPKGSVLLVEAVDRLTRMNHIEAFALLGSLLKFVDLHVVQLGKTFTLVDLESDMGSTFSLVGAIALGHMESRQKAQRLSEAWGAKRSKVAQGGTVLTRKCPQWLNPIEGGFEAIPDRVAIVREVFDRFSDSESISAIAVDLNTRKVPTFGRGERWYRSYLTKILRSEAVRGVLEMGKKPKGARRIIVDSVENYYPEVIPESLFAEVQRRLKAGTAGRPPAKNPLQGVLRCPHCNSLVVRENKGARSRPKLVCSSVREGAGTLDCKKLRLDFAESWKALRGFFLGAFDGKQPLNSPADRSKIEASLGEHREEVRVLRESVNAVSTPSAELVKALAKREEVLANLERQFREAKREPYLAWRNLKSVIENPDSTPVEVSARLKTIFPEGIPADPERWKCLNQATR